MATRIALVLAVLAVACNDDAPAGDQKPAAVYTVRGVVKELPRVGETQIFIMHEAIDDFADRDGKVVGMDAMPMPFRLQPGVSVEGIEVADKVKMTVEAHWHANPPLAIAAIEKLPADTELEMRRARPPAGGK